MRYEKQRRKTADSCGHFVARIAILVGDLVVASPQELHEAEAVPEGIGHQRELSPPLNRHRLLDRRPGRNRALHGFLDVVDDEIEMHRRPMPLVRPDLVRRLRDPGPFLLFEKVDGARAARELDTPAAETPPHDEPERRTVETLAGLELLDVDVDQEVHI